ncbi:MAG: DUF1844 domain-containing protein [Candidatus Woesearchaeota archaeon]
MDENFESEFMQLVMGLQGSTWMLLGKIANPITGKQEKNLAAAKQTIDVLVMLQKKTRGNLSRAEESLLSGAITQLQVNYVEELEKEHEKKDQKADETSIEQPAQEEQPKKKKAKKQ